MSPGGPEAITLLFKLSNLAMFLALGGYQNKENHYPVIVSKIFGKTQVESIQTVLDKSIENLYTLVESNRIVEKNMCEFYHQQIEKKQLQQLKFEEVLKKKNKIKLEMENNFFDNTHEFESFKSTVKCFWELVNSAALATDKKFYVVKSALEAYRSINTLVSPDINFKISSILLNKYHKSMFKEIGSHFIEKGEINLTKFVKVCCFGLDLIGEKLDNMKKFNLNNQAGIIKLNEQFNTVNKNSFFLDKLLSKLVEHKSNYDNEVKHSQNKILQRVLPNDIKSCGFDEAKVIQSKSISIKEENINHSIKFQIKESLLDMTESIKMHSLATTFGVQKMLSLNFTKLWKQPFNVKFTNFRRSSFVSTKLIPKTPIPSAKRNKNVEISLPLEAKESQSLQNKLANKNVLENQTITNKTNQNPLDKLADEIAHSLIENLGSSSDNSEDEFSDDEPNDVFDNQNKDIMNQISDQILKSSRKQQQTPNLSSFENTMNITSCNNTESSSKLDSLIDTFEIANNFTWDHDFEETKDFLDISISSNEDNNSVSSPSSTFLENNVNPIANSQTKTESHEIDLMYFGENEVSAATFESSQDNISEKNISVVGRENDFEQWQFKSQLYRKKRRKTRMSWYKCIPESSK